MGIGMKNSIFASSFQGMLSITRQKDRYAVSRKSKNTGKKKTLSYNPRELSGMLMGAKNAQSAAMAQARAKNKQAMLQRALASGQYNDKQVRSAIAHAKRMAECARIKVRNFKEEEQMRQQNERKLEEKMLQQELLRRKRKHRNHENSKIQSADRKYYEDQMESGNGAVTFSNECATLQLSGMGTTVADASVASVSVEGTTVDTSV